MSFDPFTAGFDLIKTGLDKFFPDANEELRGKLTAAAAEINNDYQIQIGQLAINTEEAKSPHWFVAAGRPAAIWVGVLSLAYSGIGISLMTWVAVCFGLPPLPIIDVATQSNLLYALLGVGGLRTAEKIKGVQTTRVGK
jgi:hypothetical protein